VRHPLVQDIIRAYEGRRARRLTAEPDLGRQNG
jgi:hypothetical protein